MGYVGEGKSHRRGYVTAGGNVNSASASVNWAAPRGGHELAPLVSATTMTILRMPGLGAAAFQAAERP